MSEVNRIGIFDSGVGGLTVAREIVSRGIGSEVIYFGDIAHLPYGDKSEAAIQAYSVRIAEFLVARGCDTLVIACNSASASATDLLKEYLHRKVRVVNVIEPMVEHVANTYRKGTVGLIGTKRTISSGIYERSIRQRNESVKMVSMATPLLVPVIEEDLFSADLRQQIVNEYLGRPEFGDIDALILGCTHYPMIVEEVRNAIGSHVDILDSSELTADWLWEEGMTAQKTTIQCFVSDKTAYFEKMASRFFGSEVSLQLHQMSTPF